MRIRVVLVRGGLLAERNGFIRTSHFGPVYLQSLLFGLHRFSQS
jgi:hypothetical protein